MKGKQILCRALCLALCLLAAVFAPAARPAAGEAENRETATYLNLAGRRLAYRDVKALLAQYPALRKVNMFDIPLSAAQADELAALYPQIEFGWTLKIGPDHLVRTDATAFSTLHRSGAAGHSSKALSVLRYCKKLKALDIGHNNADDISWLAGLTDLRVLIIAINKISDLTPLAGLEKLEYLEVFSNRVTDLSPLRGLTRLMDLNIGYNRITDFSPLYGLPRLKRLWIGRAANRGDPGVPQEAIDALRQKLPGAEINYRSEPTLGGWREHPHYDIIHEMFAGTYYIPFSDSAPDGEARP